MTWGQLTRRSRVSLLQISNAKQAGGIHTDTVPRRVERHLRNPSCKAVALRRITRFTAADKRDAMQRAGEMDLFDRHRSRVSWRFEPKGLGRYRKVCNLPPRLRVAQHMAKELLRAQHNPQEHICDWPDRGGCPAAVAKARDAIESGHHFLVVADIRNCHETFNPDFIYQTNLLPHEFIEATLDSREFRYRRKGVIPTGYEGTEHARPRGLLQGGAASSTLLALALDDLPDHLPSGAIPIVQSDNILIACRSQQECEAAADALSRYLSDNPAGAFSPRTDLVWMRSSGLECNGSTADEWSHDFEQFGYSFRLLDTGRCEVGLSQANLIILAGRMTEFFISLETGQPCLPEELYRQLAPFPAISPGALALITALFEPEYVFRLQNSNRST